MSGEGGEGRRGGPYFICHRRKNGGEGGKEAKGKRTVERLFILQRKGGGKRRAESIAN